jgi:broad specificity phosphatase PhoE
MRQEPAGSRLVVVSHAATIRAIAAALLELPVLSVVRFVLDPGSVSVLSRWPERDTYHLERWNARML